MRVRKRRERETLDFFHLDAVKWLTSPNVIGMSAAQEGAYIRLLAIQSQSKDCTLPADEGELRAISKLGVVPCPCPCGGTVDLWASEGPKVRAQFVPDPKRPERIFNEILRKEWKRAWAAYRAACKRNRKNRLNKARPVDDPCTTGRHKEKEKEKQIRIPPEPPQGGAPTPKRGPGSAHAREHQRLTEDPAVGPLAAEWAKATGHEAPTLGALRGVNRALAACYSPETVGLVIRTFGIALREPDRFHDRSSLRWCVENRRDPEYVLRPSTLDRLIPEAEAWHRE